MQAAGLDTHAHQAARRAGVTRRLSPVSLFFVPTLIRAAFTTDQLLATAAGNVAMA
ncbi:hypothetical protein [Reyranella sp.]|uniref:hypothetical protein n=1 Tax=Reyranella sp. TaxID=1929291 RepID=UPI003D0DC6DC